MGAGVDFGNFNTNVSTGGANLPATTPEVTPNPVVPQSSSLVPNFDWGAVGTLDDIVIPEEAVPDTSISDASQERTSAWDGESFDISSASNAAQIAANAAAASPEQQAEWQEQTHMNTFMNDPQRTIDDRRAALTGSLLDEEAQAAAATLPEIDVPALQQDLATDTAIQDLVQADTTANLGTAVETIDHTLGRTEEQMLQAEHERAQNLANANAAQDLYSEQVAQGVDPAEAQANVAEATGVDINVNPDLQQGGLYDQALQESMAETGATPADIFAEVGGQGVQSGLALGEAIADAGGIQLTQDDIFGVDYGNAGMSIAQPQDFTPRDPDNPIDTGPLAGLTDGIGNFSGEVDTPVEQQFGDQVYFSGEEGALEAGVEVGSDIPDEYVENIQDSYDNYIESGEREHYDEWEDGAIGDTDLTIDDIKSYWDQWSAEAAHEGLGQTATATMDFSGMADPMPDYQPKKTVGFRQKPQASTAQVGQDLGAPAQTPVPQTPPTQPPAAVPQAEAENVRVPDVGVPPPAPAPSPMPSGSASVLQQQNTVGSGSVLQNLGQPPTVAGIPALGGTVDPQASLPQIPETTPQVAPVTPAAPTIAGIPAMGGSVDPQAQVAQPMPPTPSLSPVTPSLPQVPQTTVTPALPQQQAPQIHQDPFVRFLAEGGMVDPLPGYKGRR